jgi:hypothetical protein
VLIATNALQIDRRKKKDRPATYFPKSGEKGIVASENVFQINSGHEPLNTLSNAIKQLRTFPARHRR